MTRSIFIYTTLLLTSLTILAQEYKISGQVLDASNQPLAGATIRIQNTEIGTVAGPKGFFQLSVDRGEYTLEISSVGYSKRQEVLTVDGDQELSLSMKEDIYELPEFVVETNTIAAGRQGMKSIPGSVEFINSVQLSQQNYTNVNDILKQVPGVNIQEEDGFGLRPNIGLRGSGLERSSKITIMEDGILAAPAPYAAPSAYYFPTAGRMNGVEVLKGSSQVRFGPFTTGGAINFLSTPIPGELSAFGELILGSFGFRNLHTHFGDRTENFGFMLEAFQYGADGFKTVPKGETGFLKNDLNAKFSFNSNPERRIYQSVTFSLGWTKEDSNETYLGLTEDDFQTDPYQRYAASQMDHMDAEQNRLSVQHYIEIPRLFNIVTTAYRNDFHRNWYKLQSVAGSSIASVLDDPISNSSAYDLMTGSVDSDAADLIVRANNRTYYSQGIQSTFDIEFETGKVSHDIHVSTRIHEDREDRFQHEDGYGIENQRMKLVSAGAPGSNANRIENAQAIASYLFYKLDIGKFSFTPGIRHEHVTISREDFGRNDPTRAKNGDYKTRSNVFSAWLPGIGVNYALEKNTQLFGGVHKGFAPGNSSPGSIPENSVNYELGIRKSTAQFQGSLVGFINDYQNLLGADNVSAGGTGSGDLFNAGSAFTQGFEFQAQYDLIKNNNFSLPLSVAYTFTDARFESSFDSEFEGWGSVSKGDQVPYLARNQWFFGLTFKTQKYSASVTTKYQSEVRTAPGSGDIASDELIKGFMTADLSLNYSISPKTSLFGSVTNLTNEVYAVARRPAGLRPGMPRSFRAGLNVRL